jgi:O-antigen ligase
MNSIATQKRTDSDFSGALLARLQTVIATAILALLLITFRPFAVPGSAGTVSQGGDLVNQLGFGAVGLISIFSMLTLANAEVLKKLFSPWWVLLIGFAFLSVLTAASPEVAFRGLLFTFMAASGILAVLTLPSGADGFQRVVVTVSVLVLVVCYAGLFAYPDIAKHTGASLEPEHAGLWRGLYTHKNIAGPVMAVITFFGIYVLRRGSWITGLGICTFGLLFVANTGSKTSAGLVPLVILLVTVPGVFGVRRLAGSVVFITIVMTILSTIGTELFPPLRALRETFAPELTYTGRTEIWKFGLQNLFDRPLLGFGFESFWLSPFVKAQEPGFEALWDVRGIIHGHNGYLDIAINMGIPAFCVAIVAMLIEPVRNYGRCIGRRENIVMADLFMMIFTFTALNACLESFFFRRADPVWLMFVLAVFGLRLTARFVVPSKPL